MCSESEITPICGPGQIRITADGKQVRKFDNVSTEVRALVEGQFILRKLHAQKLGVVVSEQYVATNPYNRDSVLTRRRRL
jgi:hypothetical protein